MMLRRLERAVETVLFASRWLLTPFFLGLVAAIALLLVKFAKVLGGLALQAMDLSDHDVVVGILTLVDVTLMANLLVIIILAGYESAVSRLDHAAHDERLEWMGRMGFSDLKLKVIGSIVAISAVELLRLFLSFGPADLPLLKWKIAIHLTFVISGLMFAAIEKLTGHTD